MIKFFNKKTVIIILIAAVLFSIAPKPASAGILDIAINSATEVLKNLFYQQITKQAVKWIQGGGNPKFVTNLPGFLRDAVDQASDNFIQQIGLSQLCSPFKPVLKIALEPVPTFNERTTCTLDTIANNFNNTIGYFKSGNWIAWNQMVSNPQNNVYGAYVMAWDQYEIEKAAAADAAKSEAQASKGFLDQKKCLDHDTAKINACLDAPGADLKTCEDAGCTNWEIATPGSIVGDTVAQVLGTKLNLNANARNPIAFAVGAIANAAINRLMKEGAGLLSSALSPTSSQKPPSAQSQCAALQGTADYDYCITNLGGSTGGPSVQTQCSKFPAGTADYNNCIIAAQCAQSSTPGTANYNNCTEAMQKCFPYFGKKGFDDCVTAVLDGTDIEKFRKDYASGQCVQFLPVATAYDRCLTVMQSDNPDIEKFKKEYASNQCAQFKGTETAFDVDAQKACLTEMQSGATADVREFEKNYILSLIDQTLDNQTQILKSKQAGLVFLNESIDPLKQIIDKGCSVSWAPKALLRVGNAILTVTGQIKQIQSDNIPALNDKKQEIEAITDLSQIPALWLELTAKTSLWAELTAEPAILQNYKVSAAKKETDDRQNDLTTWYQGLSDCTSQ